MDKICSTCLSYDRRLVSLKYLKNILNILRGLNIEHNEDKNWICWECQAMAMKIIKFRKQAINAQEIIILHKELATPIKSLSTLKLYYKDTYDWNIEHSEKILIIDSENECPINTDDSPIKDIEDTFDIPDEKETEELNTKKEEKKKVKLKNKDTTLKKGEQKFLVENMSAEEKRTQKGLDKSLNNGKDKSVKLRRKDCTRLRKDEQKFEVEIMSAEELDKARDLDRNSKRYQTLEHKCENCIVSFFSEDQFKKHMEKKHGELEGSHKCRVCHTRFHRRDTLQYHESCHYRRYKCRLCDASNHKLATMLLHYSKHHDIFSTYPCKECNMVFKFERRLRYHRETCHSQQPKCDYCGKICRTKTYLKYHIKTVHTLGNSLVQCEQCNKWCRQSSMRIHRKTHLATIDESAYCAECDVQYKNTETYRRHLLGHKRHRTPDCDRYVCTHCNLRFFSKTNLSRHISAKHLKIQPHNCHICNKKFTRKDKLKSHLLEVHEGIPPVKDKICSYCGKGFKTRNILANHIRTHTGERPFQCELCPAKFAQKSALQTHVRGLHHRLGERK